VTIYGVDLSHYDNPNVRGALDEGFSFMTHKAGGDAIDAELGAWWSNVRTLPEDRMLLGAYWVLYPGNPAGRADAFLTRLDSQCPGWRDRDAFILQADCEKWGGDPSTMPGRSDIQTFCDRLHARTGLVPVVYAPRWAYGDTLTGLDYPLWASSYVTGSGAASSLYPGDTSSRWAAYSGQTPAILQFTSSATIAGQTTCDANAHRGTLTDLKALVTGGTMALSKTDAITVWNSDDAIPNPPWRSDKATNDKITGATAAVIAMNEAHAANAGVAVLAKQVTALGNSLMTALQAITAKDTVDEHALAEALAPGVAAAVLAALPASGDPVSVDEVTTALQRALYKAFGTPPA
jgi:GH25 family lysozyme M1 (1,4-beta-N-acetylmuramidase)